MLLAAASGTLAAAVALVLTIRGPVSWLDAMLAGTALVYLPTGWVGAAIVRSDRSSAVGWIFIIAGAALPVSTALQVIADAGIVQHSAWVPGATSFALISAAVAVFGVPLVATFGVLLFPDSRLALPGERPTGRLRLLAWLCGIDLVALLTWALFSPTLLGVSTDDVPNPIGVGPAGSLVLAILAMAPLSLATALQLRRRARRCDDAGRRSALLLASAAAGVIPLAYLACVIVGFAGGATSQVAVVENVAALAIALAAWVGMIRYGLFDRRTVLSRTLLYAALAGLVVAAYLGLAALLRTLIAGDAPAVIAAAAAALIALPLHDVLRRRVNRLVFGLRGEPMAALALLGIRLDAAGAPEDVLPATVRTLADVLRLRWAAVEVGTRHLASWGEPVAGPRQNLDLPYGGEVIGVLQVQTIDLAPSLHRADQALLTALASQLGVAARAVALTHSLQESREQIVAAREEERRRLRRDLHDGLGPTLAGIALGLESARRNVPGDADGRIGELLADLRGECERAVADVRRIAYALRPPILDEMGLDGALRAHASRLRRATIDVPAPLPDLPAAVEVAAYRIATEAMTNAARHAPDADINVRLVVDGQLVLEIADTGTGLPGHYRAGVGVTSMLERAAELGGDCILAPSDPHGTLVRARIPLTQAHR